MQVSGRFGPGLDALLRRRAGYKRAITKAAGRDERRMQAHAPRDGDTCERSLATHPFHPFCCKYARSQGQTAPCSPAHLAQAHRTGRRLCGTWSATSLSSTTG